jgi:hypothetical protein
LIAGEAPGPPAITADIADITRVTRKILPAR